MIHRTDVERYAGTLAELAGDVGDLRYDALVYFLESLAAKLVADAGADKARGRPRLADALRNGAEGVVVASSAIREAWRISGPRME